MAFTEINLYNIVPALMKTKYKTYVNYIITTLIQSVERIIKQLVNRFTVYRKQK